MLRSTSLASYAPRVGVQARNASASPAGAVLRPLPDPHHPALRRAPTRYPTSPSAPSALLPLPQGGCIIRAQFLDSIRQAYERDPELPSLLVDPQFAKELTEAEGAWRRVAALAITHGVPIPSMTSSLSYFDTYRRWGRGGAWGARGQGSRGGAGCGDGLGLWLERRRVG